MVLDARVRIPFLEHPPFLLLFSHDTYWVPPQKNSELVFTLSVKPMAFPYTKRYKCATYLCQTPFSTKGWGSRHQMVGKSPRLKALLEEEPCTRWEPVWLASCNALDPRPYRTRRTPLKKRS